MKEGALQEIVYDMNWLLIVKVHNHNHPNIPYFPAYKTHFFSRKYNLNLNCLLYAEGKYLFPKL
jgi:hypothetical protein